MVLRFQRSPIFKTYTLANIIPNKQPTTSLPLPTHISLSNSKLAQISITKYPG